MAGLFPAERCSQPHHLFQHVLIANRSAHHADTAALQRFLQSQVGHDGRYQRVLRQVSRGFHGASQHQQHCVSIHHLAAPGHENGSVGVAVEGHSEMSFRGQHRGLQSFQVQSAAVQIDIAAIGLGT